MTVALYADLLVSLYAAAALVAAGHALLNKRDPRSAWAWITACWLFPLGGAILYLLFGVNRIERRARRERGAGPGRAGAPDEPLPEVSGLPVEVRELARIGRRLTGRPLVGGNRVTALHSGEQAYPHMLAAIAGARKTVWLQSYIFDAGEAASAFAEALGAAQRRGVQVRVLLDGIGTWKRAGRRLLEAQGVRVARFLPLRLWPPMLHVNLRSHHKLLCIDGSVAYIGGMNISDSHFESRRGGMADLQFCVEGPVVAQLAEVFRDDWRFAAGETLGEPAAASPCGPAHGRVVTDGPNEPIDHLQLMLLAALANAHKRVVIMTPYFIPPPELIAALEAAAMRGIEITVILPPRSDQWWADAASRRWLVQLIGRGIRFRWRGGPFAHSKLYLVDDYYCLVGSANLDRRSLRLNFELMLEVWDEGLSARLRAHVEDVLRGSREATAQQLEARGIFRRLLDAVCWLFSPYL